MWARVFALLLLGLPRVGGLELACTRVGAFSYLSAPATEQGSECAETATALSAAVAVCANNGIPDRVECTDTPDNGTFLLQVSGGSCLGVVAALNEVAELLGRPGSSHETISCSAEGFLRLVSCSTASSLATLTATTVVQTPGGGCARWRGGGASTAP